MKKPLSLEQLTLDSFRKHYYYATELKAMAKAAGIVGVSKLRKDKSISSIIYRRVKPPAHR